MLSWSTEVKLTLAVELELEGHDDEILIYSPAWIFARNLSSTPGVSKVADVWTCSGALLVCNYEEIPVMSWRRDWAGCRSSLDPSAVVSSGIDDAVTVATGPDRVAAEGNSFWRAMISLQVCSIVGMIAAMICRVKDGVVRSTVSVVATAGISSGWESVDFLVLLGLEAMLNKGRK